MPLDVEALAGALGAIAEQDAPPSRVDADRARADGRRTLRLRRTAAGLGGTGAVALIAVLAVTVAHVSGGAQVAGGPPVSQVTHTADWDPLVAPGAFGWLPADVPNVNYLIAPGPGQGSQVVGKGSEVTNSTLNVYPTMIWLSVLDPTQSALKAGPAPDGSNRVLIAAPEVNNRPAFWEVDPANRNPDLGKAAMLYFQSPSGRWAEINAYYLNSNPVVDTVLHVARTAHVGDVAVPLPVRISGLPSTVTAPVVELDRSTAASATTWSVGLSFAMPTGNGMVHMTVQPATGTPAADPTATAHPGLDQSGDHCKTDNGLLICVSAINDPSPQLLPGGFDGLLRDITSLGADPAHWTTDVVVVP